MEVASIEHDPGGGGLNVARALAEFGTPVRAVWMRGGAMGMVVGEMLDRRGVTHHAIDVEGDTGESVAVIEDSTNDHYRFSAPGSPITVDEARRLADLIGDSCDWLVLSGGLPAGSPAGAYALLAERGVEAGARVIVDSHDEELVAVLEGPSAYLIKPNERELEAVSGVLGIEGDAIERARTLIDRYAVACVVVSRGRRGALVVTQDLAEEIPAPDVEDVSRIGAGDSLVAGLTSRLVGGAGLVEATTYGVAAGAAAVTTPGTDLCDRATTDELFDAMAAVDPPGS